MTKIERVRATLAGSPVDHPPFTVWYHFGTQHATPERTAQVHLEFFEAYDLDLLKVMNDYDYPMPEGLDVVETPAHLARLGPLEVERTPLGRQLQALDRIAGALRGKALFLDTVFNAWNTLRRNLVKDAMDRLMADHPGDLERALGIVNDNLIRYARASLARGAAGIFFAVPAAADSVSREQFERFMRPFDLAFLGAIRGLGECHVLHAHGAGPYFDRLLDYPVHVLSWADLNGGPSIADLRGRTDRVLMAGIDHVKFAYISAAAVRQQVRAARDAGGPSRLILAPGCSVATYSFPPLLAAAREAARA